MTSATTPSKSKAIPNNVCGPLAAGKPKAKFKAPTIAMNVNMTRVATDAAIMTTCIALFNSLFKRIPRLTIVNIGALCKWKKNWNIFESLSLSFFKSGSTSGFQIGFFNFSSKLIYSGTSKGL
jgi:hypothetical protein